MAENLLSNDPELQPFVLSNVRATGVVIGSGAYGSVEKVEMLGLVDECAAKRIHDFSQDRRQMLAPGIQEMATRFVKECRLTSSLRHPNIVQFLGICSLPGSRLPAIMMELLMTSLHDLLEPDPRPQVLAYVPLGLKHSILCDVAKGLQYLHQQTPAPIVHRDLSAKNVLLSSAMVAKITDLGMARIVSQHHTASMTTLPGALFVYMPPEAMKITSKKQEKDTSHYSMKIDIFSLGVVAIFTLSHTFPCNLLPPTYYNDSGVFTPCSELERREDYMKKINSQFRKDHPFIRLIKQSLHNKPEQRPDIGQVLQLLDQAGAEIPESERDQNKLDLLQAVREKSQMV